MTAAQAAEALDNEPQRERGAVVAFLGACKDSGLDPDKVFKALQAVREAALCLCTAYMDSGVAVVSNPDCPVHGHDSLPARWLPIESAPRDGSYFVTCKCDEDDEYEVGQYRPYLIDRYVEAAGGLFEKQSVTVTEFTHDNFHRATHWMPLPPPPK